MPRPTSKNAVHQQNKQQKQQAQQIKSLATGRCLEALVIERLALPEQVVEFNQFEELSKLYEIEQPFVPRTQVELLFDVYDGAKLRPGFGGSMDDDELQHRQELAEQQQQQQYGHQDSTGELVDFNDGQIIESAANPKKSKLSLGTPSAAGLRRSSFADQNGRNQRQAAAARPVQQVATSGKSSGLSWSRLLFAKRNKTVGGGGGAFACCLKPSDTNQELGLLSVSSSVHSISGHHHPSSPLSRGVPETGTGSGAALQQRYYRQPVLAAACAALTPAPSDDFECRELKLEALNLIESALGSASGRPAASIDLSAQLASLESGPVCGLGPALAMESAQMESTGGCVSVCLLDKRHCHAKPLGDLLQNGAANSADPGEFCAQNGRVWARASARLLDLRRRLRNSTSAKLSGAAAAATTTSKKQKPSDNHRLLVKQIEHIARKASRKFWFELSRGDERLAAGRTRGGATSAISTSSSSAGKQSNFASLQQAAGAAPLSSSSSDSNKSNSNKSKRLDAEQLEQLVDLVKNSLNQLIDAQLLLRNKLTLGLDQPSSILTQQVRSAEYETLLRNNFNLLKIWQNLEETKRLVCFVCEPIKANLADLFAFNRQRLDWPQASAFESIQLNCNTTPTANENGTSAKSLLLISPLVSLDAVQLKRGLMQILEALNFLHGICKLIHRNLTPKNILICQNDNWKLSGLEFAIRFESTTISESSSIMAHEFSANLGPMVGGMGAACLNNIDARKGSAAIIGPGGMSTSGGGGGGGCGGGAAAAAASGGGGLSSRHLSTHTAQLRRQRTLHQTKCQEFVKWPKCLLLQPDLDYLAPEILKSSKCSHKSDLFSYGLILGQTYDLCRHKAPLACKSNALNYEIELKKLNERRKAKLAQLVPNEMRTILIEMLECEPHLRPSANHVLQILKRPIDLCKSNEDSLKHLKSSLNYLDTRLACPTSSNCAPPAAVNGLDATGANLATLNGGGGGGGSSTSSTNQPNSDHYYSALNVGHLASSGGGGGCLTGANSASGGGGGGGVGGQQRKRKPVNYFKRVTSAAANREPAGRQLTRNLQLLNHLVRAIDSIATSSVQSQQQHESPPISGGPGGPFDFFAATDSACQQAVAMAPLPGTGSSSSNARRPAFCSLRIQFEQTLETLKQVLKWTMTAPSELLAHHQTPGWSSNSLQNPQTRRADLIACPPDSRSLLLIVALHRRLLDQVTAMRADLPPICRLIGPSSASSQPLDRSLASANHRALADIEERLHLIVSKQSIGRLGEALADPLLKLDEFLLVFELVNDLVRFVGQKCKLNYAQRGKQLLNELTPVTGCPSLSSSEEEYDDDDDDNNNINIDTLDAVDEGHTFNLGSSSFGGSNLALANAGIGGATRCQSISVATSGTIGMMNNRISQQQQQDRFQVHHDQYQQKYGTSSSNNSNSNANYHSSNNISGGGGSNNQYQESGSPLTSSRPLSRQQQQQQQQNHLYNFPTSINITAPSPMGSTRDMSRASLASSSATDTTAYDNNNNNTGQMFSTVGHNRASVQYNRQLPTLSSSSNGGGVNYIKRHSHQDVSAFASSSPSSMNSNDYGNNNNQGADYQLADRTSQMSLTSSAQEEVPPQEEVKSRSKLIDELLKTINDDSFNDFIDFNNRLSAATKIAPGNDQDPANAIQQRPKSAIGVGGSGGPLSQPSPLQDATGASQLRGHSSAGQQQLQQDDALSGRPRALNLNSTSTSNVAQLGATNTNQGTAAAATNSQQLQHHQRYQTRGSVCNTLNSSSNNNNQSGSTFDNVIRRMSTNIVQNFNKMSGTTLGNNQTGSGGAPPTLTTTINDNYLQQQQQQQYQMVDTSSSSSNLRREKSSASSYTNNSLYVDNQVPARRHSDNTINVPRIQVALSSPQATGSRANLNMRAGVSATKLANKWKLTAKTNQREASDKLSPNLGNALGYIRRHSSGNTKGEAANNSNNSEQNQSNGLGAGLLNMSPFKQQARSNSNLGLDFLTSNRSMKRRCSAASMLGHQTQRKAEDLIDAGMKSVQNMFN